MVINASGVRLTDGSKPGLAAINDYLKGIEYGGKFNNTKLVYAIQKVEGVLDIELGECLSLIHIFMLGRQVEGITALSYKDSKEKENIYGAGEFPVGRGEGTPRRTHWKPSRRW